MERNVTETKVPWRLGYDAGTGEYVNMLEQGILDPAM